MLLVIRASLLGCSKETKGGCIKDTPKRLMVTCFVVLKGNQSEHDSFWGGSPILRHTQICPMDIFGLGQHGSKESSGSAHRGQLERLPAADRPRSACSLVTSCRTSGIRRSRIRFPNLKATTGLPILTHTHHVRRTACPDGIFMHFLICLLSTDF